jgi:hypothetical protein
MTVVNSASDPPSLSAPHDTALHKVAFAGLGVRILELGRGDRLTLIGVGCDRVGDALRAAPVSERSALLLETDSGRAPDAILRRLLDDLADLALDRWPRWYGRDDPAEEGLVQHAMTDRLVSPPWVRAAAKRAGAGHRPRFRKAAKALEFVQLMRSTCLPRRPR